MLKIFQFQNLFKGSLNFTLLFNKKDKKITCRPSLCYDLKEIRNFHFLIFNVFFRTEEKCLKLPVVLTQVFVTRCVDNKCGGKGNCQEFFSGMLLFSSCECLSGIIIF